MTIPGLLRRKLRSARFHGRVLLGGGRLPGALIIGAAKAGTTSLFEYLVQHPQVCGARFKEVRFFDRQWERGSRWYRANFAPGPGQHLCIEATPAYLHVAEVPARVHSLIPEAKLIVLVREPIARAFSHYNYRLSEGTETLSFEEALALEEHRSHRFAYRDCSLYWPQISRWRRHFPDTSILFLKSERLFEDPTRVFGEVLAFLGLEPHADTDFTPRNRRPHELPDSARALLHGAFDESNAQVKALTGIDWKVS